MCIRDRFMRPDQLEDELVGVIDLVKFMMESFHYKEYDFELSVRDPLNKEQYVGCLLYTSRCV